MTANPKLPWAEDVNYWQTGKSSPDSWIDKAIKEIASVGGKVLGHAYGSDIQSGRSAYMLQFQLNGEQFKISWPVLPSRGRNQKAAQIQAATMLYHDAKARCVSAKVLGGRAAFLTYLQLPDGRNASEATATDLVDALPAMFRPMLPDKHGVHS